MVKNNKYKQFRKNYKLDFWIWDFIVTVLTNKAMQVSPYIKLNYLIT